MSTSGQEVVGSGHRDLETGFEPFSKVQVSNLSLKWILQKKSESFVYHFHGQFKVNRVDYPRK